jgi:hypothetical protein
MADAASTAGLDETDHHADAFLLHVYSISEDGPNLAVRDEIPPGLGPRAAGEEESCAENIPELTACQSDHAANNRGTFREPAVPEVMMRGMTSGLLGHFLAMS